MSRSSEYEGKKTRHFMLNAHDRGYINPAGYSHGIRCFADLGQIARSSTRLIKLSFKLKLHKQKNGQSYTKYGISNYINGYPALTFN